MRYFVTFPSSQKPGEAPVELPVDVEHSPAGDILVTIEGRQFSADAISMGRDGDTTSMRIDGKVVDLVMEGAPPKVGVAARGLRFYVTSESERMRALEAALGKKAGAGGDGVVTSPMPGRVLKVLVSEGDDVAMGQALIVVEAMKMENELLADRAGVVKKVFVTPGQTVEGGAKLIEIG